MNKCFGLIWIIYFDFLIILIKFIIHNIFLNIKILFIKTIFSWWLACIAAILWNFFVVLRILLKNHVLFFIKWKIKLWFYFAWTCNLNILWNVFNNVLVIILARLFTVLKVLAVYKIFALLLKILACSCWRHKAIDQLNLVILL